MTSKHMEVIPVSGDKIRGKFLFPNIMSTPDMGEI
jgi:hypothetical protein